MKAVFSSASYYLNCEGQKPAEIELQSFGFLKQESSKTNENMVLTSYMVNRQNVGRLNTCLRLN